MPQARDSHIPSSGQSIPHAGQAQSYATKKKRRTPDRPADTQSRARRRIILVLGIAACLFAILLIWLGVRAVLAIHAKPTAIASFSVTSGGGNLYTNFQLANSEGELVSATGSGTIAIYNDLGNLLARQQIAFTKEDFNDTSRTYSMTIPKTILDLESSVNNEEPLAVVLTKAGTELSHGRAALNVITDNNEDTLTAVCQDIQFYSVEEAEDIVRTIYFQEEIQVFEEEINEQWSFKVKATDYVMVGDRGWVVVSSSGSEIVFYPDSEIYDWYLLESQDSGVSWDIAWGGNAAPLFMIEITEEDTFEVTTPSGIFNVNFQGEEAVDFVDPDLSAVIGELIGMTGNPIYPSDLEDLTRLSAVNLDISDLTGLEFCTNLESVELQRNQIHDVSPIASLTNLTSLILHDNEISDISALASLTGLKTLELSENQIEDIRPLGGLKNLESLDLSVNHISDISPLAGFTDLAILMLQDNQIRDISSLADNHGLGDGDTVGLTDNPLSEISLRTYLPDLRERGVNVIWPVTAPSVVTGGSSQDQDLGPKSGPAPRPE